MIQYGFEDSGEWWTRWFCPVPEKGQGFVVVKEDWVKSEDGKWIREIYEIKLDEAK